MLIGEQLAFALDHGAFALAVETAERTVRSHDAMAGYFGRKGIALKGLAYGLSATATDALGQLAVSDGLAARHFEERQVDLALKRRNGGGGDNALADAGHCKCGC